MIAEKIGEPKVFGCVWERNKRKERENLPRKTALFILCKMRGLEALIVEK